jgi:hypothetical protein
MSALNIERDGPEDFATHQYRNRKGAFRTSMLKVQIVRLMISAVFPLPSIDIQWRSERLSREMA